MSWWRSQVTNADGQIIFSGDIRLLSGSIGNKELDLSEYAAGVYFMQVVDDSQVTLIKIIKQ